MSEQEDGRRVRWDEHNAQRRTRILDAAVRVLEREPVGAEIHVQQIGHEAGVGRTVIYRHFADKADLDRSLRAHVLAQLTTHLRPHVSLTGSVDDVIRDSVGAYVRWAHDHPKLHHVAERASMSRTGELDGSVGGFGAGIAAAIRVGAAAFGATLSEIDESALEPMVLGIIGGVHGTVHAWLQRTPMTPASEDLVDLISASIWYQIDGFARARGVAIDPQLPIGTALVQRQA